MVAKVTAFAPAKINLTLHVTGQQPNGYHLLDSLVAFADIGDEITATAADKISLTVDGPMAAGVPTDSRNLMLKALALLPGHQGVALNLTKNLPAASGIGGGSSDAAATLRAVSQLHGVACPEPVETLPLGADLPVCMTPQPQRMSGIGEILAPVHRLPQTHILLVNPGVEVSTPSVFKAMQSKTNAAMPLDLPKWASSLDFITWLGTQRNDLQAPAIEIQPIISDCLNAISETPEVLLTRMSGSGATCFGLYPTAKAAQAAKVQITQSRPNWWVQAGVTSAAPASPF